MDHDPLDDMPEQKRRALVLLCDGVQRAEVARQVGVNRATITKWCGKAGPFQDALIAARAEGLRNARDSLAHAADDAARTVIGVMRGTVDGDARLKLEAARMVLDRVGLTSTQVVEVRSESAEETALRIAAIYGISGPVIEATASEAPK